MDIGSTKEIVVNIPRRLENGNRTKCYLMGGRGKRKEKPMEPVKLPVPFGGSRYEISRVSAGEPLGVFFLDFLGFL